VFVAEHARRGQVGFAVGLLTCGLSFGILLGSLIAAGMNLAFGQAQIAGGFWHIPFVIGGLFGFIVMLLRRWLEETPVFEEMRRRAAFARELPLRTALRNYRRSIAASVLMTWMLTAAKESAAAQWHPTGAESARQACQREQPSTPAATVPLPRPAQRPQ
jgi:MFS family permease